MEQLNPSHLLLQQAKKIPWQMLETEFSALYAKCGKPAKPIRLMVGLSILKHLDNLGNAALMRAGETNSYSQAFYRGFRGVKSVGETAILIPQHKDKNADEKEQQKQSERFRKRASIEPVMSHLKTNHRMNRNFLVGKLGDQVIVLLAASRF